MIFVVYMIFRISVGYAKKVLRISQLSTQLLTQEGYCFNYATIVADSAIECYEICLPHTYILYSFALFFYPLLLLLTLDSHYYIRV